MKLNKNKQIPIGMLFLVLAIILNKISKVNDLIPGILYGISIAVLIMGMLNKRG